MPDFNPFAGQTQSLQSAYDQNKQRMNDLQAQRTLASQAWNGMGGGNASLQKQYFDKYGTTNYDKAAIDKEWDDVRTKDTQYQSDLDLSKQRDEAFGKAVAPFQDIYNQQKQRADQFRFNFPSILDSSLATERVNTRRDVAGGVANARQNYNSRGLLYGGLRRGAEVGASADANAKFAQKRADITNNLNQAANALDQDVIDTGSAINQVGASFTDANNAYRQQLMDALMQKSQQNDAAVGSLLGGAGSLAGAIAGGLSRPKDLGGLGLLGG